MSKPSKQQRLPRWAFVVVALLAGHVTLMMTAVTFALRGYGSAGVEPNYYARAVAWDADQELLRDSDQLGWQVAVTSDIWRDSDNRRKINLSVFDADGVAVERAEVALMMHHAVYPTRKADATLREQGEGVYTAKLPGLTAGLWRIDVRIVVPDSASTTQTQWFGRFDQQIADVVALGEADSEDTPQPQ
ncbi:MAG: FixH family protein [Planctomycetota bacterium]